MKSESDFSAASRAASMSFMVVTLVPLIRAVQAPGQSLLAGILILALMVLPTVMLLADSALGLHDDLVRGQELGVRLALGRIARRVRIRRRCPGARCAR